MPGYLLYDRDRRGANGGYRFSLIMNASHEDRGRTNEITNHIPEILRIRADHEVKRCIMGQRTSLGIPYRTPYGTSLLSHLGNNVLKFHGLMCIIAGQLRSAAVGWCDGLIHNAPALPFYVEVRTFTNNRTTFWKWRLFSGTDPECSRPLVDGDFPEIPIIGRNGS